MSGPARTVSLPARPAGHARWQALLTLLCVGLGVAAFLAGVLAWSGLTVRDSVSLSVVLAANVAAGGALLGIWLRRTVSAAEAIGGGVVVAVVWVMSVSLVVRSDVVVWYSLPIVGLALTVLSILRPVVLRPARIAWNPAALGAGFLATGVALVLNRYQWDRYRLTSPIDYSTFHPDNVFLQVVAIASHAVGSGTGGMSSWPLRYHWLSYAMSGGLESVTDSQAFAGLTRALPVLAIIGLTFLASGWAARSASQRWVAYLAALMVVAGRFVADLSVVTVNWDSLSQTISGPILVFACYLAVFLPARRTYQLAAAFIVLGFVLAGTKLSAALVLVCGLVALATVSWLRRSARRNATAVVAVAGTVGAVLAFVLLESGQAGGGGLAVRGVSDLASSLDSARPTLATTLALLPGWAGLIYLAARSLGRWSRGAALGVGLAVGGLGTLWVLDDVRPNNIWFLVSATTGVWVISAVGAGRAVRDRSPDPRSERTVVIAALIVATVVAVAWTALLSRSPGFADAVVAQAVFVALLVLAAIGASSLLRRRRGLRVFVPLLVTAATMSALTVVVAGRIVGVSIGMTTPAASVSSTAPSEQLPAGSAPTPSQLDTLSRELALVGTPGDIVAFDDRRLIPGLFGGRLIPYAANEHYATGLSTEGSTEEFERRRTTIDAALAGDGAAIAELCQADVRWLVGASDAGPASLPRGLSLVADDDGYRIMRVSC